LAVFSHAGGFTTSNNHVLSNRRRLTKGSIAASFIDFIEHQVKGNHLGTGTVEIANNSGMIITWPWKRLYGLLGLVGNSNQHHLRSLLESRVYRTDIKFGIQKLELKVIQNIKARDKEREKNDKRGNKQANEPNFAQYICLQELSKRGASVGLSAHTINIRFDENLQRRRFCTNRLTEDKHIGCIRRANPQMPYTRF